MPRASQGVRLFWSTSTAIGTAATHRIGYIENLNGPSGSKPEIDITSLESVAKEFLMGLPDYGELTFNVFQDTTSEGQTAFFVCSQLATSPKRRWTLKISTLLADGVLHGKGYAKSFAWSIGKDDAVKASASIRITGAVTFSTV